MVRGVLGYWPNGLLTAPSAPYVTYYRSLRKQLKALTLVHCDCGILSMLVCRITRRRIVESKADAAHQDNLATQITRLFIRR